MPTPCGRWPTTRFARHYPELAGADSPYLEFFGAVVDRQAPLIARWQLVGFIHGVMNTDNMAVSGETIDYGPCAFMDAYDPDTVFSSIDTQAALRLRQPAAASRSGTWPVSPKPCCRSSTPTRRAPSKWPTAALPGSRPASSTTG